MYMMVVAFFARRFFIFVSKVHFPQDVTTVNLLSSGVL